MPKPKRGKNLKNWRSHQVQPAPGKLRIIGGHYRGRQIDYSGDQVTRPMKDNIREALFNLVGGWVKGKAALDLFAGTGAIGIEAISRGASQAILIERHFPAVKIIERNIDSLDIRGQCKVDASDTFFWARKFVGSAADRPSEPWVVFCCPPYQFFIERTDDVLVMLNDLIQLAPADSIFVVESDRRFDTRLLPQSDNWEIREYSPACVSILKL